MQINLEELASFLVKAKVLTYPTNGRDAPPQRPHFRELEYHEGEWDYRDSYAGFYRFQGQEVVRFRGKPVWAMGYSGGMGKEYHGQVELAAQTFSFLKKALVGVNETAPFRGPAVVSEEISGKKWDYENAAEGNIEFFSGMERILLAGKEIYRVHYMGGGIISR
ncbi:hypothetical protein HYU22_03985 [Candidatus Woesearchaeota archaeon]|nr:hypothetical protein [Candidatus Woesearchaeota archaeon]